MTYILSDIHGHYDKYRAMLEMELYTEAETGGQRFGLAHAGLGHFTPDKPLDRYDLTDLLFGRPGWDQVYFEDRLLIFGQTPTRLLWEQAGEAPSDRICRRGTWVDIDCGCGFGGPLGCLCAETLEEFYA